MRNDKCMQQIGLHPAVTHFSVFLAGCSVNVISGKPFNQCWRNRRSHETQLLIDVDAVDSNKGVWLPPLLSRLQSGDVRNFRIKMPWQDIQSEHLPEMKQL